MTGSLAADIAVALLGGYLVGSVPFGVLIARAHGVNLRAVGSGNVGATNVGRTLGRKWGVICFVLDAAKGAGPVVTVGLLAGGTARPPETLSQVIWIAAGLGAILGHVLCPWLRFRGGKGVATALGVVLGMYPYLTWAGLVAFAVWGGTVLISRYVSVASIVAAIVFLPLCAGISYFVLNVNPVAIWPLLLFVLAMVVLIIYRHKSNIARLLTGRENRIR